MLFPPSLDEYITEENPVRFIDAFVDHLDLQALGFKRAVAAPTGRPAYYPGDLLKLYLYGYLNRVRSSRLLERETQRNVEVMWLLKKLMPDFKTIADFRKDNLQPRVQARVVRRRIRRLVRLGVAPFPAGAAADSMLAATDAVPVPAPAAPAPPRSPAVAMSAVLVVPRLVMAGVTHRW